ncbi:hypothetical protein C8R47DRAFT_1084219 [Mycena vitilis]|nr:hypothetical protein C8R47DRAFT_1084219 [Mycena vitilis]
MEVVISLHARVNDSKNGPICAQLPFPEEVRIPDFLNREKGWGKSVGIQRWYLIPYTHQHFQSLFSTQSGKISPYSLVPVATAVRTRFKQHTRIAYPPGSSSAGSDYIGRNQSFVGFSNEIVQRVKLAEGCRLPWKTVRSTWWVPPLTVLEITERGPHEGHRVLSVPAKQSARIYHDCVESVFQSIQDYKGCFEVKILWSTQSNHRLAHEVLSGQDLALRRPEADFVRFGASLGGQKPKILSGTGPGLQWDKPGS